MRGGAQTLTSPGAPPACVQVVEFEYHNLKPWPSHDLHEVVGWLRRERTPVRFIDGAVLDSGDIKELFLAGALQLFASLIFAGARVTDAAEHALQAALAVPQYWKSSPAREIEQMGKITSNNPVRAVLFMLLSILF